MSLFQNSSHCQQEHHDLEEAAIEGMLDKTATTTEKTAKASLPQQTANTYQRQYGAYDKWQAGEEGAVLNYEKAPSNKMSNGQLQNFLKTKLESAGEVFILQ